MDAQSIAHLRDLVEKYPYFHTARILLLQALHRNRDVAFDGELRASAPMVPNPQAIFRLVEERNYSLEEEHRKFANSASTDEKGDRTGNLIDEFLQNLPQEHDSANPMPVDATQDYIGYLMQSSAQSSTVDSPLLEGNEIIDDFLMNGSPRITIQREDSNTETASTPPLPTSETTAPTTDFLTETLAGIYIKQGKYENAVKILKQISLKNPQKSRYFADQLRFLDKLILNNKNKK